MTIFHEKVLLSSVSIFSRKDGQPSVSRSSRHAVAKARRRMSSWGSQIDLADELRGGLTFSRSSAGNKGELLDYDDVISLTSFDTAASALLGSAQEEQESLRAKKLRLSLLIPPAPAYNELSEVMDRATARLDFAV